MSDIQFEFSERDYIVIGASSGIGKQTALDICESGGRVFAIARDEEKLRNLREQFPDKITTKSVDVRDKNRIEEAIEGYVSNHDKFCGSVYTAGISKTTVLRNYSQAEALNIMDINFWGWINAMGILCKKRYTKDGCSHVVISSVAAHTGEAGNFAYDASKASISSCVKTFAKELAYRKCRVNSISPGYISTPLTEGYFDHRGFSESVINKHILGLGEPEDISGMILYLLTERAKWITGADFIVDGGYLISD